MEVLFRAKLVKPADTSNQEFFRVWRNESIAAVQALDAGMIKNIWKVAGKYEVVAVFEIESGDQLDAMVHALPFWKEGYAHVVEDIEVTPLRPYRNWASDLETLAKG